MKNVMKRGKRNKETNGIKRERKEKERERQRGKKKKRKC